MTGRPNRWCGCCCRAFPLLHGGDYVCLGFAIGGWGRQQQEKARKDSQPRA